MLLDILESVLKSCGLVYIVIDALDESMPRHDLLKVVRDLATDPRFSKIQLLATSREYLDIERIMEDKSVGIPMANDLVNEDIRTYLRVHLHSNARFSRWPEELLLEVEEAVCLGAKGMYVEKERFILEDSHID
jgi:hypothetical protein